MRVTLAAVLAAVVSLAVGCATPSGTRMTSAIPLSGNWEFFVGVSASGSSLGTPPLLAGSLMMEGNNASADFLSGLLLGCSAATTPDIVLTGTVSNSKITMASTTWGGTVFSVNGSVSSDGQTISGNWSGKGGCADGQSGSLQLQYIPPMTGTWSGVLGAVVLPIAGSSNTPQSAPPGGLAGATLTFQLQQSATPVQFSFPLSGTIAVSGSTCGFKSGTLLQVVPSEPLVPSSVTGPLWNAEATMDDGSQVIASGVRNPISGQWTAVLDVFGGSCDGAEAEAMLSQS